MAYERRELVGGAVAATLASGLTDASTTADFTISSATGWPSGSTGKFFVIVDAGSATEEKILCTSRSGTTISGITRGQDGTSGSSHTPGSSTVKICITARDADEANDAVSQTIGKVTTKGDSIVATSSATFGRLAVGADHTVRVADSTQTTGQKWATLTPQSLANLTGIAKGDVVGATGLNTFGKTVAGGIDGVPLVQDSTASTGVTFGGVGVFGIAAGAIINTHFSAQAWTSYTPTWGGTGVSLGNGTIVGYYRTEGKSVRFRLTLTLGSTSNPGTGLWTFTLPSVTAHGTGDQCVAGFAVDDSTSFRYPCVGVILAGGTTISRVAVANSSLVSTPAGNTGVNASDPFTWATSDKLTLQGEIEIA